MLKHSISHILTAGINHPSRLFNWWRNWTSCRPKWTKQLNCGYEPNGAEMLTYVEKSFRNEKLFGKDALRS